MDQEQFEATLTKFFTAMTEKNQDERSQNHKELTSLLSNSLTKTEENLGKKVDQLSSKITDLQDKQEKETQNRQQLQTKVEGLEAEVKELREKLSQAASSSASAPDIVNAILPLVTESLSEKINSNTAEVKAYNAQAKATYFQSLANEIKSLEKEVMLYGFRADGNQDLAQEILNKVFNDILELNNILFKANHVGIARGDRPQPIRISFASTEGRNAALSKAFKLPKSMTFERCMPSRYRNKNKEFRRYGWEIKQVDKSVTTRTIFKGHKLVLEMKQKDEDDNRFDWTIVKEYYPEPESPTAQNEVAKNRIGLKPSKTLEMIDRNYIFLSDLWKKESKEATLKYFTEVFVAEEDRPKVLEVDSEF